MNTVARVLAPILLTLAGLAAFADEYPEGCVSCHVATEKQDMRLNVVLAKIDHSMAGQRTAVIPIGCTRCHADADSIGGALSTLVHRAHYTGKVAEEFIGEFDGGCQSCHKMDDRTGKAGLKSGDRNWELRIGPPE
jgi:hypothetical protein